jgi:hypothetical protein
MEHSHSTIDFNVTKKIYWEIYDIDIFNLLKIYQNVTYSIKTSKFNDMFPNIKKKQIMDHMKYIYILKNHMNLSQMTKFNHHTLNAFKNNKSSNQFM